MTNENVQKITRTNWQKLYAEAAEVAASRDAALRECSAQLDVAKAQAATAQRSLEMSSNRCKTLGAEVEDLREKVSRLIKENETLTILNEKLKNDSHYNQGVVETMKVELESKSELLKEFIKGVSK